MEKEKTKLGKFLQSIGHAGVNVVQSIALGDNPLSAILGAVSGGKMSKENADLALQMHQEDLKDVQDARHNETLKDTSENTPLLSKLIHELLAIVVIGSWIVSWFVKVEIPQVQITGAVMLILGYLYGRTKPQS